MISTPRLTLHPLLNYNNNSNSSGSNSTSSSTSTSSSNSVATPHTSTVARYSQKALWEWVNGLLTDRLAVVDNNNKHVFIPHVLSHLSPTSTKHLYCTASSPSTPVSSISSASFPEDINNNNNNSIIASSSSSLADPSPSPCTVATCQDQIPISVWVIELNPDIATKKSRASMDSMEDAASLSATMKGPRTHPSVLSKFSFISTRRDSKANDLHLPTFIGLVALCPISTEVFRLDSYTEPAFAGSGYTTEAVRATLLRVFKGKTISDASTHFALNANSFTASPYYATFPRTPPSSRARSRSPASHLFGLSASSLTSSNAQPPMQPPKATTITATAITTTATTATAAAVAATTTIPVAGAAATTATTTATTTTIPTASLMFATPPAVIRTSVSSRLPNKHAAEQVLERLGFQLVVSEPPPTLANSLGHCVADADEVVWEVRRDAFLDLWAA